MFFIVIFLVVLAVTPDIFATQSNKKKNNNSKKNTASKEHKTVKKNTATKQFPESAQEEEPIPHLLSHLHIRVLLHEQDAVPYDHFYVESADGFLLESAGMQGKKGIWKANRLNLAVKNNTLYMQCKDEQYRRVKDNNLVLAPAKEVIHLNKKSYHGKLNIRIDKNDQKLLIINRLNLDDYIFSVLRNEMLSYWPLEIQKVQAIASRTYALHHMRHGRVRNPNRLYDIKNTNIHQVYGGSHDCKHLRRAVNETHNLILTYNNNIALTMFDICCGGVIPAHMAIKDDDKPYLFRKNRCVNCKESSTYFWHSTYQLADISQAIKQYSAKPKETAAMGKLLDVAIAEKDQAGIVKKLRFAGAKKKVTLTMQDFKRCLNAIGLEIPKSYAFDLSREKGCIKLSGKGYGHNIGLCQVGAHALVKKGWNYKEILSFYYPETTLARLQCS